MLFKSKYRVETARLKNCNYSANGHYCLTLCTRERVPYFGRVENGEMILTEIGIMAEQFWREIPDHFPFVRLDEYVIMPDHIHGIIVIEKPDTFDNIVVETQNFASLRKQRQQPQQQSSRNKFGPQSQNVGSIVRGFKIGVKKWAAINHAPFAWQPRFHDRIIRNDVELNRIREYIANNPNGWNTDREHPGMP